MDAHEKFLNFVRTLDNKGVDKVVGFFKTQGYSGDDESLRESLEGFRDKFKETGECIGD